MLQIKQALPIITFILIWTTACSGQQIALRKNMLNQQARNTSYSQRSTIFTKNYQVGNLVRTVNHDSLATAKGMSSWQYGIGAGAVMPLAGPLWINLAADYQYRNYKMRSDEKSLLAQVDRLQKHKIALHTLAASAYLRLSTSRNKPLQCKYIEFGYSLGYHFANRLLVYQSADPSTALGSTQIKTKYKNTTVLARQSRHICVRMGREKLAIFAEYRLSDFFRRSPYIQNNNAIPELSRLTIGLTFLIHSPTEGQNTDEDETTDE